MTFTHEPFEPTSHEQAALPVSASNYGGYLSPVAASRGSISRPPISAALVLRAAQRWWKLALPAGLILATVAGAVVWLVFKPMYEASVWLKIENRSPYIAFETKDNSQQFAQTQVELIKSPVVLTRVLSKPEVAALPEFAEVVSPLDWLTQNIEVRPVGRSELYRIRIQCPNAANASMIVNAVADTYLQIHSQEDVQRNQRVIELLDREKESRAQIVERLRKGVRELSREITGRDPFVQDVVADALLVGSPIAALQQRMTEVEVESQVLEAQIKAFEEATQDEPGELSESAIAVEIDRSPEVQARKQEIAALRVRMADIRNKSVQGELDVEYRRIESHLADREDTLAELRAELDQELREGHRHATQRQWHEELAAMQRRVASLKLEGRLLAERYQEHVNERKQTGDQSLELEFARAELQREEKVFELIASRTLALRTEMRAPGRVTLLERAGVPAAPVQAIPVKQLGVACLLAFCFPLGGAVFWEYMARRIGSPDQLIQEANLPLMGEVAQLPLQRVSTRNGSQQQLQRGIEVFEESVDCLRTLLVLSDELKEMKVLAVTSAVSGEGKTSLASQLAVSMARASGEQVLLIDGDMRSPDVHKLFQVTSSPGLAQLLSQQATIQEAIRRNARARVDVLPGGRLTSNPHKLLRATSLQSLLEELRHSYRYIVIDTPPVLCASEALLLSKVADATLVCTMRDVSRVYQVRAACDRIAGAGGRLAGTVFSGTPTREYASTYGDYTYARG